jgi:DNA topoisomerase-1
MTTPTKKAGKKLLIVESPAKARTIQQYLGNEYEVLASVGHVRDLPKSNKDAVDIEDGFIPHYVISPDKREVIERIKRAAATASDIFLATDPDREGEAIAWHIKEAVGLTKPKRVVFHEITKAAVEEALAHPRLIDEHLRKAQEARRVLDRIVGYDLSGLIWKKVRYGLSAGRVQSPALRILAEREREIKAFIPETYFVLDAEFKSADRAGGMQFPATCSEKPSTAAEAERIVTVGRAAEWSVAEVTERAEERNPRPPFTTSTLQQVASTRLGFSPSRTMRAAQKLYEAGHITYMRTDSVNLSIDAVTKMLGIIENKFGKEYAHRNVYKTKSKNAQEAHEAVRPTDPAKERAGATPDETQLYDLIRIRTLASQMAAAKALATRVRAKASIKDAKGSIADAGIPLFNANGSRITFPGWLALDTRARGEDVELPKLAEGEALTLLSLGSLEKQTEPPNRYTEAGLVKELEKRGIGRPSTYASIMKTIQDRGYVEKEGRTLTPTATGMVVSGWLEEHFAQYISDEFTAEMEDELDEISRGERGYEKTMQDFYTPFEKAVRAKDKLPKATALGPVPEEFKCPICGSPMEFKLGRGGIFMSCTRYPECLGARQEDGLELKADEPLGNDPATGAPIYVRTGRYGPYVEMLLPETPEDIAAKEAAEVAEKAKEEAAAVKLKKKGAKGVAKKTVKKKPKGRPKIAAKRASVPPGTDLGSLTLADALKFLSLPRELGISPSTGKMVSANTGRFGPYIMHDGEFRSIKKADPYTITLDEALTILATPKQPPRGVEIVKEIGKHPKTGKMIVLYKSKQGLFLKKGLRRIYLPENQSAEELTPAEAASYLA